jgi:hypothetical protein
VCEKNEGFLSPIFSTDTFFKRLTQTIQTNKHTPTSHLIRAVLCVVPNLIVGLLSEGAAFCQSSFATSWLGKHNHARSALDDGLGVGKDGGDVHAARAFYIHEVGVWCLYQSFELVCLGLVGFTWVEEINDRHV